MGNNLVTISGNRFYGRFYLPSRLSIVKLDYRIHVFVLSFYCGARLEPWFSIV